MTGPEHYKTAQTLLANLRREVGRNSGTPLHTPDQQARMIAEAQVHATLALTAATAEQATTTSPDGSPDHWHTVLAPTQATR